jgi:hypothetical protein
MPNCDDTQQQPPGGCAHEWCPYSCRHVPPHTTHSIPRVTPGTARMQPDLPQHTAIRPGMQSARHDVWRGGCCVQCGVPRCGALRVAHTLAQTLLAPPHTHTPTLKPRPSTTPTKELAVVLHGRAVECVQHRVARAVSGTRAAVRLKGGG